MSLDSDDFQLLSAAQMINVVDGDFACQLLRYVGESPHLNAIQYYYNLTKSDVVYQVHMDFLRAGANLIRTNTYHAFLPYLQESLNITSLQTYTDIISQAAWIARKAVDNYRLERMVCRQKILVAGSCGHLKLSELLRRTELMDHHRIQTLLNAGVDVLAFDGTDSLYEAETLAELIRQFPNARVWMTLDGTFHDKYTFKSVVPRIYNLLRSQIIAIGVSRVDPLMVRYLLNNINDNCASNPIPIVACACRRRFQVTKWKPATVITDNPALEWAKLGIRYIGGCRHVRAEDIRLISEELNRYTDDFLVQSTRKSDSTRSE